MNKARKLLVTTAGITGLALTAATPAFASFQVGTAYGNNGTANGTATINRSGASVTVTVNLDGVSSFWDTAPSTNFTICSNTVPFTAREAGKANCEGVGGTFFTFPEVTPGASTATETFTLPAAYNGAPAFLQINVTTNQGGVQNTTMACWQAGSPFYGNCAANSDGTNLPIGAFGAMVLGGVTGGAFLVRQRRRNRKPQQD